MIDLKFAVEAGYFHNIKQFDDYLGEDLRRFYKNLLNKKPQGKLHDAGIDSRVTAELFQQTAKRKKMGRVLSQKFMAALNLMS